MGEGGGNLPREASPAPFHRAAMHPQIGDRSIRPRSHKGPRRQPAASAARPGPGPFGEEKRPVRRTGTGRTSRQLSSRGLLTRTGVPSLPTPCPRPGPETAKLRKSRLSLGRARRRRRSEETGGRRGPGRSGQVAQRRVPHGLASRPLNCPLPPPSPSYRPPAPATPARAQLM